MRENAVFKVFIGWHSSEAVAYEVAKYSMQKRSSVPLDIRPLKVDELRKKGIYWRDISEDATEFTYSRYLIPHLMNYDGWALFCDSDFLFLSDVAELLRYTEGDKGVYCVSKMPAFMLLNCGHPAAKRLTLRSVNHSIKQYLRCMAWAEDDEIGELPEEWNWLEGQQDKLLEGLPKAIHYTKGGPWLKNRRGYIEYEDLWTTEHKEMMNGTRTR